MQLTEDDFFEEKDLSTKIKEWFRGNTVTEIHWHLLGELVASVLKSDNLIQDSLSRIGLQSLLEKKLDPEPLCQRVLQELTLAKQSLINEKVLENIVPRELRLIRPDELVVGQKACSREVVRVFMYEQFEASKKFPSLDSACATNNRNTITFACADDNCKFKAIWKLQHSGLWCLAELMPHEPSCQGKGKRSLQTCYPHAMLARSFTRLTNLPSPNPTSSIKLELPKYIQNMSSNAGTVNTLVSRICAEMNKIVYGDDEEEIKRLPMWAAAMETKGHRVRIHTITGKEAVKSAREATLSSAKKKLEDQTDGNKDVKALSNELFNELRIDENATYVIGCTIVFSTAKHSFEHSTKITAADHTHIIGKGYGTMATRVILSANRNAQFLALGRFTLNESGESWNIFTTETINAVPSFATDGVEIGDHDKGMLSTIQELAPGKKILVDVYHRTQTLVKGKIPDVVNAFNLLSSSYNQDLLNKNLSEIPTPVKQKLSKVPDSLQYPVATSSPDQEVVPHFGITNSSSVESLNRCLLKARQLPFVASIKESVFKQQQLYDEQKRKADECQDEFPPKVKNHIDKQIAILNHHQLHVIFKNSECTTAQIIIQPQNNFQQKIVSVDLNEVQKASGKACTDGCMFRTGWPCWHVIAAVNARKDNAKLSSFMNKYTTTAGWKEQYEKYFLLPSDNEINQFKELYDENLKLMPQIVARKGRPNISRVKGVLEKGKFKKKQKSKSMRKIESDLLQSSSSQKHTSQRALDLESE